MDLLSTITIVKSVENFFQILKKLYNYLREVEIRGKSLLHVSCYCLQSF